MSKKDLPSYFVMFGACICIILLVAARHHPPSRQKIKEIWHGRVYWENSSEVSMASPDKPEMPDIKTNLRTTSKEQFTVHQTTLRPEPINFDKDIEEIENKKSKLRSDITLENPEVPKVHKIPPKAEVQLDQRPVDLSIKKIQSHEKIVFSQNGEDGILEYLFDTIGTTDKYYVEFGAQDGTQCNTRYLRERLGWSGLTMDGSHENKNIGLYKEFITSENIVQLFEKYNVPIEFMTQVNLT